MKLKAIAATILSLVVLVGCVPSYMVLEGAPGYVAESLDVSTGITTAVIEGRPEGTRPCYITQPAHAARVTVDSGPVSLTVICVTYGRSGNLDAASLRWESRIHFVAAAGHTYEIKPDISSPPFNSAFDPDIVNHIVLVDRATEEVVAREQAQASRKRVWNPSISQDMARIFCSGCYIVGIGPELVLDASLAEFTVSWWAGMDWGNRTGFGLDAEAGHTYLIQLTEFPNREFEGAPEIAQCILLVDWTDGRQFVSCDPFDLDPVADGIIELRGDISTNDKSARIICSGCLIYQYGPSKDVVAVVTELVLDAGDIQIDVYFSILPAFGEPTKMRFHAQSGHTYFIQPAEFPNREFEGAPEIAECGLVVDWTEDRQYVDCNSYHPRGPRGRDYWGGRVPGVPP